MWVKFAFIHADEAYQAPGIREAGGSSVSPCDEGRGNIRAARTAIRPPVGRLPKNEEETKTGMIQPRRIVFKDDGLIPNSRYAVLLYGGAIDLEDNDPGSMAPMVH